MTIFRIANSSDYEQLAEMKWQHAVEDDHDYGEHNVDGVEKTQFIKQFANFCGSDSGYTVYVACNGDNVVSAMFVYLLPKVPKPNGSSHYIAYLTNVYTVPEYRNQGIGSQLLTFIKNKLVDSKCELLFAWPSDNSVLWYTRNGFTDANDIFQCTLCEE